MADRGARHALLHAGRVRRAPPSTAARSSTSGRDRPSTATPAPPATGRPRRACEFSPASPPREWGPQGIHVNTLCPFSRSPRWEAFAAEHPGRVERQAAASPPAGHPATPSLHRPRPVFLVSDDSSYVTGQTPFVEGGRSDQDALDPPRGDDHPLVTDGTRRAPRSLGRLGPMVGADPRFRHPALGRRVYWPEPPPRVLGRSFAAAATRAAGIVAPEKFNLFSWPAPEPSGTKARSGADRQPDPGACASASQWRLPRQTAKPMRPGDRIRRRSASTSGAPRRARWPRRLSTTSTSGATARRAGAHRRRHPRLLVTVASSEDPCCSLTRS